MRKFAVAIILIIGAALLVTGILRGNLSLINGFGIFLCLDCIGIS